MGAAMSRLVIAVHVDDVREYGATCAIVLQQLRHFGTLREAKDGWVKRSLAEWESLTGLSSQVVHRTLHKLRDAGVIEVTGAGNGPKSWRVVAASEIAESQTDSGVGSRDSNVGSRDSNAGIAKSQSAHLLQIIEDQERAPESPDAAARRVLDVAWAQRRAQGRTPTNFHAALAVTKKLLASGRPESDVVRGLVEAPTISVGAVEVAIERGRPRKAAGNNHERIARLVAETSRGNVR